MASYRDVLKLKAVERKVGNELIAIPTLPLLSEVQSLDEYIGWEHFNEMNEQVVGTTDGRVSVAFKHTMGSRGADFYTLEDGRSFKTAYAKPLNNADYQALATHIYDYILNKKEEGIMPRHSTPNLDELPFAAIALTRLPSGAELAACSQFAIQAGTLVERYADDFAELSDARRGEIGYIQGALAMQLVVQLGE